MHVLTFRHSISPTGAPRTAVHGLPPDGAYLSPLQLRDLAAQLLNAARDCLDEHEKRGPRRAGFTPS